LYICFMETKPEILAPAGDMDKLKIALAYGADAVYAGIPKFSLRTRETAFTAESIRNGIDYVHRHGKNIYLTLNIFPHNLKVDAFLKELDAVVPLQPDALIMADPGMIAAALKRYPDMPLHLSTQANTVNWATAAFWRDLGVRRIILSRELSLEEIAEIHDKVPDIELEAFVHGAICIAYSGRCLISNYLHFRDANQGTCTNSCRWEYRLAYERGSLLDVEARQHPAEPLPAPARGLVLHESERPGEAFPVSEDIQGTYLMNSKDLCAIELLPELIHSGVCSMKIEGRTKSAYYTAVTARAYRRALDAHLAGRPFDPEDLRELMRLSNRTYTTGFYTRNPRQYGENFRDGLSEGVGEAVAGRILHYDPQSGLAVLEVKNRFSRGEKMTLISPGGNLDIIVDHIEDEKGLAVECAHGGGKNVRIPLPSDPGDFAFIRKRA